MPRNFEPPRRRSKTAHSIYGAALQEALLRLAQRHGRTSNKGIRVNLTVSQSELGAYLGMTRENVNRQLGQSRNAGVIRMKVYKSSSLTKSLSVRSRDCLRRRRGRCGSAAHGDVALGIYRWRLKYMCSLVATLSPEPRLLSERRYQNVGVLTEAITAQLNR